jgi:DNA-directed RNA polymerase beta subunit
LQLSTGVRAIVSVESTCPVYVGDKLSTQYSQKGVVGAIWQDEDMPFSMVTGVSPDIIASPLSITSRMTMNALLEAQTGKVVAVTGNLQLGVDGQDFATSLTGRAVSNGEALVRAGFERTGKEKYIDGRTGEVLTAEVFTGIVSYARLVHMSSKKLHVRSTGPRDPLTRQPRDGRRFGGGLRIGEMEVSAMAAHGASKVLQERVNDFSDHFDLYMCTKCNMLADACDEIGFFFCENCITQTHVRKVSVPFTLIVMMKELEATGVRVTLTVSEDGIASCPGLEDH